VELSDIEALIVEREAQYEEEAGYAKNGPVQKHMWKKRHLAIQFKDRYAAKAASTKNKLDYLNRLKNNWPPE